MLKRTLPCTIAFKIKENALKTKVLQVVSKKPLYLGPFTII